MKEFLSGFFNQFYIWLCHLFTPHCDECIRRKQCHNCDELYQLIERERAQHMKIIEMLTAPPIKTEMEVPEVDYTALKGLSSWPARRAQLERDAYLQAHRPKDINDANQ